MVSDRIKDAALMARVAAGDRRAQRELVDNHLGGALNLAMRMLQNRAAAEDVCQDAFMRLWQQTSSWQPQAKVATWLYRVVHNRSIDELRRRRRFSDNEVPEPPDPAPSPMERQHSKQVRSVIEAHLSALPVRQRTAITLVHFQDLSNIEAAEIMDVSVEAMESLLSRGRRTLREGLEAQKTELLGAL